MISEDWLKLCDAITYFNYGSQSILPMNLFKDFKVVFTHKKWLTNLILTERVKHCLN